MIAKLPESIVAVADIPVKYEPSPIYTPKEAVEVKLPLIFPEAVISLKMTSPPVTANELV